MRQQGLLLALLGARTLLFPVARDTVEDEVVQLAAPDLV